MSQELKIAGGLKYVKSTVELDEGIAVTVVDVSGNKYSSGVVDLTTGWESIPVGEIATLGWAIFINLGANPVELARNATDGAYGTLKAGESCQLRLTDGTTPSARSALGSTLQYLILED